METNKTGNNIWATLRQSIQKRGIRIKMTIIIAFIVLGTVGGLAVVVIPVQQNSITVKAFKVCEVTALSISATAAEALLSGQSILLNDIVRGVMNQDVEGLTEVSIIFKSKFFVSSDPKKVHQDVPEELMTRLRSVTTPVVDRKEISFEQSSGGTIQAFEFVRPIFYQEKRVGYTRIIYSKAAIEAEMNRLKTMSAITALVVVLVALGIVYYVSLTISKPIVQVADAAKKVGDGNLEVSLKIDSLDELGVLAYQFNHMVGELKEKLAMSKFVSSSTVSMIKGAGGQEMQLGGERKELAFFFSDVRGFTAMSEKKSPEDVVSILNEYLDLQAQVIRTFGGDI
ncbi:MAG: HAMP domain-containing protein, partial [Spirochaetia bacterium]|nr:HAMP domain-containing protein [Spirochaetia bacterium]